MNVKLLTGNRNGTVTGVSRYSRTLLKYLQQAGVDAQFVVPQMGIPGPVVGLGRRLGWDLESFFGTYPLSGSVGTADLYHLDNENLASMLAVGGPQPSVVTVHAFFTYFLRKDPELSMYGHVFHRWFDCLAARGLKQAQAIIAVSHYVKSLLVEQLSLPADHIHVIPEAVDHDFFYPRHVPQSFYAKHHLDPSCRYLLYVGSEQPRKNFLTLVRAFARVRAELSHVRLLKVGQAELPLERLKAVDLIKTLHVEGDVSFLGHVGAELPLFYAVADVFAFPSRYEGFGFPPLEAMACGTPVLCSNATSLPEVVGNAALLFHPEDEDSLAELLYRLLSEPELRATYRDKGLAHAATFSWTETTRKTVAIYNKIVE